MNDSPLPAGLRQARVIGVLLGAFLILNALRDLTGVWPRWNPAKVTWPHLLHAACVFYIIVGATLLLPWHRIMRSTRWKLALGVLSAVCVSFAFAMITEVMAKNYLAQAEGLKAKPPVFQAILLFAVLAQPPVAFFLRRPELLD